MRISDWSSDVCSSDLVLPSYLLYAGLSGCLIVMALLSLTGWQPTATQIGIAAAGLLALAALKLSYWLALNRADQSPDRSSAIGLAAGSDIRGFERPHTEQSFITREMGFVLARKHARVLRLAALVCSVLLDRKSTRLNS